MFGGPWGRGFGYGMSYGYSLFWVIGIIVFVLILFLVFRRGNQRGYMEYSRIEQSHEALEILKMRYAKGEISEEEYVKMKKLIEE